MKCLKVILCVLLLTISVICIADESSKYVNEKERKECFKLEDEITKKEDKHKENIEKIENEFNKKMEELKNKNLPEEEYNVKCSQLETEKDKKINEEKEKSEKDKNECNKKIRNLEKKINDRLRREGYDVVINLDNILFDKYEEYNPTGSYKAPSNGKSSKTTCKISRSVRTEGMAAIINNDEGSAKDKAVIDCQVKALEEVVGVFIDAQTKASNFTEIDEKIYQQVKGYIESCKVDEASIRFEKHDGGRLLYISCDCVVNVNQVFDSLSDIKTLYNKVGKPKFVVIASSNSNNRINFCPMIETAFVNRIKELGFDAVDSTAINLQRSGEDVIVTSYYSTLKNLGVKLAFVIDLQLDEETIKLTQNKDDKWWAKFIKGLFPVITKTQVNLNIKLIDVKTGGIYFTKDFPRTFEQFFKEGKSNEIVNDMLYKFFHDDVDKLKNELFNRWADIASENVVNLTVKNIEYSEMTVLLKEIQDRERFFIKYEDKNFDNNQLTIKIFTKCDMNLFVNTLEGIVINGKKLKISSANDAEGTLTVEFVPAEPEKPVVINVTNISLNKPSIVINKGATYTLIPTIIPDNATNKEVQWKTSNSNIATVDKNGCVKGIKKGNVIVKAVTLDGNKVASCEVTVKQ